MAYMYFQTQAIAFEGHAIELYIWNTSFLTKCTKHWAHINMYWYGIYILLYNTIFVAQEFNSSLRYMFEPNAYFLDMFDKHTG